MSLLRKERRIIKLLHESFASFFLLKHWDIFSSRLAIQFLFTYCFYMVYKFFVLLVLEKLSILKVRLKKYLNAWLSLLLLHVL